MRSRLARLLVIALVASPLLPAASHAASSIDGNFFYETCRDRATQIACTAFVAGVSEGVEMQHEFGGGRAKLFCKPQQATFGQMVDIYIQYLRTHPEQRHMSAAPLVVLALVDKFPCKSIKK